MAGAGHALEPHSDVAVPVRMPSRAGSGRA